MDAWLRKLASTQADVVAAWQLVRADWTRHRIAHQARAGGWRRIHDGVYVLSHAPLTRLQRWWGATLTTPATALTHGSAAAAYGFYRFEKDFEVVTRPGHGGRRRIDGLLVFRSTRLEGETRRHLGMRMTTPERTLVDIGGGLDERRAGRCLREALRLRATTADRVAACVERHGGHPGAIAALATRYRKLPYHRTRSDAEALALEVLHDAGLELPAVNVRVAGEEADLVFFERRAIVEIDGPQYHRFRDEDARKTALWRKAGFSVRRVPSGVVYDRPAVLVAACLA